MALLPKLNNNKTHTHTCIDTHKWTQKNHRIIHWPPKPPPLIATHLEPAWWAGFLKMNFRCASCVSSLSLNTSTNNIYVHIVMVPTYTWLKATSSSCPKGLRDFMPIAQRYNPPKKIIVGLVYRVFTTIGFCHVKNNNLLCMWFRTTPLKILLIIGFLFNEAKNMA